MNEPLKVLLPSRGMTLRTTPAVSASPRPPEVLTHHFLRAGHVAGHVPAAGAAAGPPGVDAVGVGARIVAAAAVDGCRRRRRSTRR